MEQITIIGYGRFGKVLHRLLRDDFEIAILHHDADELEIRLAYQSQTIFFAVPIDQFESVIKNHQRFFKPNQLLIDVLSVKMLPNKVFRSLLKNTQTQALLTHPMFGPDSSRNGFDNLPLIIDQCLASDSNFQKWRQYFETKNLRVITMTPQEHDRLSANSQGLTHMIGRVLESMKLTPSPIDTLGTKKLLEVMDQTCHDSWQLFENLETRNPYSEKMRRQLSSKLELINARLAASKRSHQKLVIGIQGGKGSFNEEAIQHFIKENHLDTISLKYLHTSDRVMKALRNGDIDMGQCAIHNSAGGIVEETIQALAATKCHVLRQFGIPIRHALMIPKGVSVNEITTIMTHPQVLAQCQHKLHEKYPELIQTSGVGNLIDHALVAKHLSLGKLPRHVATMGSKVLAEIYDLEIIEDNLQDLENNITTFIHVANTF